MHLDINILRNYFEKGLVTKCNHPYLPICIWNYTPKTQYEKLWDKITLLCRALVTDFDGNILARSFNKFFNIEEEKYIPNEPFEVYEKLDGSLILVFWYKEKLIVASKGSFSSDHSKEAEQILKECNFNCLEKNKSYSFELIVPWNKIVCDYGKERKLVLLAKFDNEGKEYEISEYFSFFDLPRKFNFQDLKEIKKRIPKNEEGYVIKFKNGKRIKIKSEEYVRIHKLISNVTEKFILEMMANKQEHELESIIQSMPDELHSWIRSTKIKIKNRFDKVFLDCSLAFKKFDCRKEAAHYYLTQKYPNVLFAMLDNQDFNDMIWKIVKLELKNELQQNNRN